MQSQPSSLQFIYAGLSKESCECWKDDQGNADINKLINFYQTDYVGANLTIVGIVLLI